MLAWIIQTSIMSIIFILLVHHLIMFFKTTLTVPKVKDLVNSPNQKYQNIYNTILSNSNNSNNSINTDGSSSYTDIDLLPSEETKPNDMKSELKSFLKKQLNPNANDNLQENDVMGFSGNHYSNF